MTGPLDCETVLECGGPAPLWPALLATHLRIKREAFPSQETVASVRPKRCQASALQIINPPNSFPIDQTRARHGLRRFWYREQLLLVSFDYSFLQNIEICDIAHKQN